MHSGQITRLNVFINIISAVKKIRFNFVRNISLRDYLHQVCVLFFSVLAICTLHLFSQVLDTT